MSVADTVIVIPKVDCPDVRIHAFQSLGTYLGFFNALLVESQFLVSIPELVRGVLCRKAEDCRGGGLAYTRRRNRR